MNASNNCDYESIDAENITIIREKIGIKIVPLSTQEYIMGFYYWWHCNSLIFYPFFLVRTVIPFLLKSHGLEYLQIGIFTLLDFPYKITILWAPFADSHYSVNIGMRKTWLVSIQLMISFILALAGWNVHHWLEKDKMPQCISLTTFTFFSLYMLSEPHHTIIDVWALNILNQNTLGYVQFSRLLTASASFIILSIMLFLPKSLQVFDKFYDASSADFGLMTVGH